jgi:hypothetical protein
MTLANTQEEIYWQKKGFRNVVAKTARVMADKVFWYKASGVWDWRGKPGGCRKARRCVQGKDGGRLQTADGADVRSCTPCGSKAPITGFPVSTPGRTALLPTAPPLGDAWP